MHVLFADEFGHEGPHRSHKDKIDYNPTFGYGGFVIPAYNLDSFATHFFDLKTAATRRQVLLRSAQSEDDYNTKQHLRTLDGVPHDVAQKDYVLRGLAAKMEVKGEEVFSSSRAMRLWRNKESHEPGAAREYREFFNYARAFLKLFRQYGGEIFFFGVEKAIYKRSFHMPHVKFVENVLLQAYKIALKENSTISIFLDNHQSDVREKDGWFRHGPRAEKSRTVIMERRLFERITEPVIALDSKESQCIQAADWICYLFSQTLPIYCAGQPREKYRLFHDEVEQLLFQDVSDLSEFRTTSGVFFGKRLQHKLRIAMPPVYQENGKRPYHSDRP